MIYHVAAERIGLSKRIARVMIVIAIFVLGNFAFHFFWLPSKTDGNRLEGYLVDGVVFSLTAFFLDSVRKKYDLEVDDEAIRMTGGLGVGDRTVRRGRIRYLREFEGNFLREPALHLSEHGRIARFFLGYVSIPASLPEYAQLRSKAMSWMSMA